MVISSQGKGSTEAVDPTPIATKNHNYTLKLEGYDERIEK